MRFDRLHSVLALVLLGGFASLRAQEAVEVKPSLDELKLVAQQAAIPHLGGGNPFILRESTWRG